MTERSKLTTLKKDVIQLGEKFTPEQASPNWVSTLFEKSKKVGEEATPIVADKKPNVGANRNWDT